MRLQHDAVVCDGGHRAHELQRRHGDALADGRRRNVGGAHVLRVEEDAALLAGQADARRLAEAEELRVFHEVLRAEAQADLREARVERLLHDIRERHRAEARAVPVLDAAPGDHDVAGVDEDLVWRDDLFLQRGARHDGLEGRARLVDERDGAVLPRLRRVVLIAVGVVARPRGHREHVARLRVHDDAGHALRVVLRHRAVEFLLDDELHRAVERELDGLAAAAPVGMALEDGVEDGPLAAVRVEEVLCDLALDETVIGLLDAVEALVLRADEADDVGGERVARIVALRLVDEAEAVRILLLAHPGAHRLVLVLREEMLEPDEAAALLYGGLDVLRRLADERREPCGERRRVLFLRLARIDEERFHHDAHGELAAVAVEDGAARRLRAELLPHLRAHARCELVSLDELQPGVAQDNDGHGREHHTERHLDAAPDVFSLVLQRGNSLPDGTTDSFSTSFHQRFLIKIAGTL